MHTYLVKADLTCVGTSLKGSIPQGALVLNLVTSVTNSRSSLAKQYSCPTLTCQFHRDVPAQAWQKMGVNLITSISNPRLSLARQYPCPTPHPI